MSAAVGLCSFFMVPKLQWIQVGRISTVAYSIKKWINVHNIVPHAEIFLRGAWYLPHVRSGVFIPYGGVINLDCRFSLTYLKILVTNSNPKGHIPNDKVSFKILLISKLFQPRAKKADDARKDWVEKYEIMWYSANDCQWVRSQCRYILNCIPKLQDVSL